MTITTFEQYESSKSFLRFLNKVGISSGALNELNVYIIEVEGPEWELCECCDQAKAYCRCDDGPAYYAEYDDEASFD